MTTTSSRVFKAVLASIAAGSLLFSAMLLAADGEVVSDVHAKAAQAIALKLKNAKPSLAISDVKPSPMPGLYQGLIGGVKLVYVSENGDFIVDGSLFSVSEEGIENITERQFESRRAAALKELKEEDMVVFRPKGDVKAVVYAFTDIDCGYCRKLHGEINDFLALGIQVNYLAYPRAGVNSPSGDKAASVWCADDRRAAMTAAKSGQAVKTENFELCRGLIEDQHDLGGKLGVEGTPAIFTQAGRQIGGYVPADRVSKILEL